VIESGVEAALLTHNNNGLREKMSVDNIFESNISMAVEGRVGY
jgi:hypothetical protein